ncbi:DNA cytosine methyltransferase [Commensalibacter melissae]|uniref:DNA cytosine methyltransferase n=1 Tax=Commensalibacter melissae TaxID=2070537 RepID=UPI0012D8D511|nr:DNA cytosine methyltransferase [Commensalibacter melissae]MUH05370.1 DNA (cytosine-5-)-methyltransferase [Commensalibacter melissae]
MKFIDLFAGAGGLSEGFTRAGFSAIAHVESDKAACFTLKTRQAYHWLKNNDSLNVYKYYLINKITRYELYQTIPEKEYNSVIHASISKNTLNNIFSKIDNLLNSEKLDVIIGGPPCQAYSLIGRARKNVLYDDRNELYIYYAAFLKRYKPKYFVFENVVGLLSAKDINGILYFDKMKKLFAQLGYEVSYKILSAYDYGVLQNRKRVIVIGKYGLKSIISFPDKKEHYLNIKVWDLFSDLPNIQAGEGSVKTQIKTKKDNCFLQDIGIKDDLPITWHQARPNSQQDLTIYHHVVDLWNKSKTRLKYADLPSILQTHKSKKSFNDRFKIVAGDLPFSHTIMAHLSKDGHYYIHPDIKQNRSITPREAARIQSFPDNYYFESTTERPSRSSVFKQIGNAVPVLFAESIATHLLRYF